MPVFLRRAIGLLSGRLIYEHMVWTLARRRGSKANGPPAVVGFFSGTSGVAVSAQLASRALDQLGIEHRRIDVGDPTSSQIPQDMSASVWLFYVNPPELMPLLYRWGGGDIQGLRYAHWAWELTKAPRTWRRACATMNGVMAQSRYTAASFHPELVTVTPHPLLASDFLDVPIAARLPALTFTVVTLFDFNSSFARKNPLGAIEAFQQACGNDPTCRLLIKAQNAEAAPDLAAALLAKACSNVELINEVWSRKRVLSFIAQADALISLHRAEGFGLTLAEAMMLGTPVVATAWSGNLDLMDMETACLVPAHEVAINDPQRIYSGQVWAEPDVDHAAQCLRRLRRDRGFGQYLAENARRRIETQISPAAWFSSLPPDLRQQLSEGRLRSEMSDVELHEVRFPSVEQYMTSIYCYLTQILRR